MPLRTALLSAAGCFALTGCGAPADSPAAATPTLPTAELPPEKPAPQPQSQPPLVGQPAPKPVDLPAQPNDLAAKAVRKAMMPASPAVPALPTVKAPRPRMSELDGGDVPTPRVVIALPPAPLPKGKPALPSPPAERPPLNVGDAAAVPVGAFPFPDRPLLKAAGPANPGAADLPAMARQLPDRASVEDPTVELSAKGVIQTPFPLPAALLPYLKEVIPNPFEFAEQLKGKLGKETEFGAVPAVVNPEKR